MSMLLNISVTLPQRQWRPKESEAYRSARKPAWLAGIVDIHQGPIHLSATPMTYEYVCQACGHQWEAQQSIKDSPLKKCVSCGEDKAKRLVSGGTGFLLKGGGWYADLYGSPGSGAPKAGADDKAAKAAAAGTKSEGGDTKSTNSEAKSSGGDSSSSSSTAASTSTSPSTSTPTSPASSAKAS
jgi:putative FmdB family regulatory protein